MRFVPTPEPRLGPRELTDAEVLERAKHIQQLADVAQHKLREVRGQIDIRPPGTPGVISGAM
jgi:hypothetical protein